MEVASIIASIVSVIVGFVAIALAAYFYTQSKNIEREVSNALASIQAQTDALQKLTGRWMDRLTRYATESRPSEDTLMHIARVIGEIPTNIASQLRAPAADATAQALLSEVIAVYIATYYYTAVANVALQAHLPALESVAADDRAKKLVDQSYIDFNTMDRIISSVNPTLVQASVLNHLYREASTNWKAFVKDSTIVYQSRASEG